MMNPTHLVMKYEMIFVKELPEFHRSISDTFQRRWKIVRVYLKDWAVPVS